MNEDEKTEVLTKIGAEMSALLVGDATAGGWPLNVEPSEYEALGAMVIAAALRAGVTCRIGGWIPVISTSEPSR